MNGLLAIETSTDACSVATLIEGVISERCEIIPRQHNQRLFPMLRELIPHGDLRSSGIKYIVYGAGPGSFTGLRIAASAVQGLAFACELEAVAVSTLAGLAHSALRQGLIAPEASVLCCLDARINEIYASLYSFQAGCAVLQTGPRVCAPADLHLDGAGPVHVIGSGGRFVDQFPAALRHRVAQVEAEIFPTAVDLFPHALASIAAGEVQRAEQVQPVYVRNEVSWKKLPEQGKAP